MTVLPLVRKRRLHVFACELWKRPIGEANVISVEACGVYGLGTQLNIRCEDHYTLDGAVAALRRSVVSKIKRRFAISERKNRRWSDTEDFWAEVRSVKRDRGTIVFSLLIAEGIE